ncbi:outer membrane protein [Nostoc phage N1]|nr:outer membrane protein [Nostoc phage N1]
MDLEKDNLNNNDNDQPDDSGENNNEGLDPKLEARLKAIEEGFNNALNGVVKKLEKKLTIPKPEKPPESKEPESKDPETLTIAALKNESQKAIDELRQQLEDERKAREADKRSLFLASVDSQISTAIAKQGFDDPEAALTVFKSMYNLDSWQQGTNGYIIFKPDEESEGKTLESVIKDWSKSPVGKRFFNKNLPNGSGMNEPETNKKAPTSKDIFSRIKQAKEEGFTVQRKR